jgi:hypothetical protein
MVLAAFEKETASRLPSQLPIELRLGRKPAFEVPATVAALVKELPKKELGTSGQLGIKSVSS